MNDDSEKYAALIAEDREAAAQEGRDPVVPEQPTGPLGGEGRAYDPGQDGPVDPPHHQPQYQELPPYEPPPRPDVYDDPIGHFDDRLRTIEQVTGGTMNDSARRDFHHLVEHSERAIRQELPDYDEAIEHLEDGRIAELNKALPDGNRQAEILAHQYGLQSAAQLRLAILNRDRASVSDWALRNGRSPAEVYYQLASERGYRPKVAATNTQRRQLGNILKQSDGKDFDTAWSHYERLAKREEQLARGAVMSEIGDLRSDQPAKGEPAISPGQVALYMKTVNAERPCEVCGSKKFTMCPEPDGETGYIRGVVWLACRQCNALRTFLRPPIVAWLRSARGA